MLIPGKLYKLRPGKTLCLKYEKPRVDTSKPYESYGVWPKKGDILLYTGASVIEDYRTVRKYWFLLGDKLITTGWLDDFDGSRPSLDSCLEPAQS